MARPAISTLPTTCLRGHESSSGGGGGGIVTRPTDLVTAVTPSVRPRGCIVRPGALRLPHGAIHGVPRPHAARLARPRAVIRVDGAGRDPFTHRRVALTGSGFCPLSRCLICQQCASASVFLRNLLRTTNERSRWSTPYAAAFTAVR